jgi:hypothetical protein
MGSHEFCIRFTFVDVVFLLVIIACILGIAILCVTRTEEEEMMLKASVKAAKSGQRPKTTTGYDKKCKELAEHFLPSGVPEIGPLAQHIQNSVEDWLEQECNRNAAAASLNTRAGQ